MADADPDKRAQLVDELLERKEFVDMWVMKWAELLQIRIDPTSVSYKAMLLLLQLAAGADRRTTCRSTRWSANCSSATGGTFANPATNYYQNETDTLKTAENVAQVFMGMRIQCAQCHNHPVRPLDDGRLLRVRRLLLPDRPQAGRGPPRADRLQPRRRRSEASGGQAGRCRRSSSAATAGCQQARTAARCSPSGWPRPRTRISPATWPTSSGPTSSAAGSSSRWTTCGSAIRRSIPELLDDAWPAVHRVRLRLQAAGPRHLHLAHLPAGRPRPTTPTQRDERTSPRPRSAGCGPRCCSTVISQVTETKNKFRGLPLGARAVQIADGNTSQLFPDDLRPGHAGDGLLLRSEDGAEPVAGAASAQRRHGAAEDPQGGVVKTAQRRETPAKIIEELYLRTPHATTKCERTQRPGRGRRRGRQSVGRRSKIRFGHSSTRVSFCSTTDHDDTSLTLSTEPDA